jgi:hypothetical protein
VVRIVAVVVCDACGTPAPGLVDLECLTASEVDEVRAVAHGYGWRRYRPGGARAVGDFCSNCVRKHGLVARVRACRRA